MDYTQQRVSDEDEETLHGVDPLKFLEQAQIEQCICLSVRHEDGLRLRSGLPVYLFDETELFRGD